MLVWQLTLEINLTEVGYKYNVNKYTNNDIENIFYQESPYVEVDAYFGKGFVFEQSTATTITKTKIKL